ncbi:putative ABC transporter ATP-binding protein [Planctomycetes bacterium Pla163]|uniref:Putative ABC transporter ATP-binding protein n=1 Tax=Rohdeia mirabilis TaxID=2528008 RepID=A0A518D2Y0_9BACT|nr:putative ABC transporter ATP-binding protein [Planctomycetes bacterium Pla163]
MDATTRTATEPSVEPADRSASGDAVIRFENVVKVLGGRRVLDGLNFEVPRGETLVIMGPSGTGKSVTLRHIVGLMQPDEGRVVVDGSDMSTIKKKELAELRKRTGYLFQDGALINWLNVGENVALPLRENTRASDDEIHQRVVEKLELVRLPDIWDKMPGELSGGMRKRVGLARALVTDPQIVLYDEPNAGLDPETSNTINTLMRDLADRLDITSVVVTHLVSCVRTVADRVILLDGGGVVVDLPKDEFLSSDNERLRRFLGQDPD